MYHRTDLVGGKHATHETALADIALDQRQRSTGDRLDAAQRFRVAVGKIIDDQRLVSRRHELDAGMAPDVTAAAGDEKFHFIFPCW